MMEEKKNELVGENIKDDSELEFRAVRAEHKYRKPPKEKKAKKPRLGITHSSAAKTMAFILCILMLCVTALSVAGVVLMFEAEVYWTYENDVKEDAYFYQVCNFAYNTVHRLVDPNSGVNQADIYIENEPIAYIKAESTDPDYEVYERKISEPEILLVSYVRVRYDDETGIPDPAWTEHNQPSLEDGEYDAYYTVTIGITNELPIDSELYWIDLLIDLLYTFKFWIYAIGFGSLIIAILCFVFLMCSAGRRRGMPGVRASFLTKIPFEIPTAVVGILSLLGLAFIDEFSYYNDIAFAIALILWAIVTVIMLIFWCMSLAIRIKLGTLLKNTIVFYILRFIWRVLFVPFHSKELKTQGIPLFIQPHRDTRGSFLRLHRIQIRLCRHTQLFLLAQHPIGADRMRSVEQEQLAERSVLFR